MLEFASGSVITVMALGVHDRGAGSETMATWRIHAGQSAPGIAELAVQVMPEIIVQ